MSPRFSISRPSMASGIGRSGPLPMAVAGWVFAAASTWRAAEPSWAREEGGLTV
jgi:hypothetical protein